MEARSMKYRKEVAPKPSIMQWLAVFSIAFYIVAAALFETSDIFNPKLASYALYACLAICAINLLRRNKVRFNFYLLALLLFGIALSASYFYSPAARLIKLSYLYRFWSTFILAVIITNTVSNKREINIIINSSIIAGASLAVFMYSHYGLENLADAVERMDNLMGNQNHTGVYFAFAIILSFYKILVDKNTKFKLLYVALAVLTIPAIMFTGSRKAVVVVVIAILFLFVFYYDFKNILKSFLLIGILLLAVYLFITKIPAFSVISERFSELFDLLAGKETENTGDINRVEFIKIALEGFMKKPVFGQGFCYSYYLIGTYSHNNFTEILLNNGLLGMLLCYYPKLKGLFVSFVAQRKNKELGLFALVVSVAFLSCDIGAVTYYNRFLLLMFSVACKALDLIENEHQQIQITQETK